MSGVNSCAINPPQSFVLAGRLFCIKHVMKSQFARVGESVVVAYLVRRQQKVPPFPIRYPSKLNATQSEITVGNLNLGS